LCKVYQMLSRSCKCLSMPCSLTKQGKQSDSMEKLQIVQEAPYLAEWNKQHANYAREESQQVAHPSTAFTQNSQKQESIDK